jgi:NADPH2:quinone reductase
MLAAWYDRQGPAPEVLQLGELTAPQPAPGELRVRITRSGINPGDTKKRSGWQGTPMAFPRIIPHSDGAGVIDAVGDGVDSGRIGQRAWVYGAQSYRPFGTAAQWTCVPELQAVPLPDGVSDELAACLSIPGITAHRAVFSDGPVAGKTVLVHGVLGSVSSLAAQLARGGGATVIGTVVHSSDLEKVDASAVSYPIALDDSDNADLDTVVVANDAVIAAYASRAERPECILATVVRQHHATATRKRRLPTGSQTAGRSRSDHRRKHRCVDDSHRCRVPTYRGCCRARTRRSRTPDWPHSAHDPGLTGLAVARCCWGWSPAPCGACFRC